MIKIQEIVGLVIYLSKFKYYPGDKIGPNNILFLKRTEKKNNHWYGIFECPICHDGFEASIGSIQSGQQKACRKCGWGIINYKPGDTIGFWTILCKDEQRSSPNTYFICRCRCGNIKSIQGYLLKSGISKSCGCRRSEVSRQYKNKYAKDLTGKRFGKLVAIRRTDQKDSTNHCWMWECQCDCGNKVLVGTNNLMRKRGGVRSCGCLLSKGEAVIGNLLEQLKLSYTKQQNFDNCINPKTKKKLKFDFYIHKLNLCLEYDGQQHFYYKDNKGWNNKENFETRQYLDSIKNQYCKEYNIKLIRIPYWDYDRLNKEYFQKALQCPLMDLSKTF